MRKASLFVLAIAAAAASFSCSSIDKAALAKIDSVALVSVVCDRNIGTANFTKDVSALAIINNLANMDAFNLDAQATAVKDEVLTEYAQVMPFSMVDEAAVLENPEYRALVAKFADGVMGMNAPAGYCAYYPNTILDDTEARFISAFPDVSGFMMVAVNYQLVKSGIEIAGFGNAVIRATMLIKVIDRAGKTVMYLAESADSDPSIPYALGDLVDTKALPGAVIQATDKVRAVVLAFLKKNL